MSFETTSLLLNLVQLGVLLAILFRLHHTFDLTANTQRELRRAIHRLDDAAPMNGALTQLRWATSQVGVWLREQGCPN
jgi:hypothetical protein